MGDDLFHADGRTDKQIDMTELIVLLEILQTRPKITPCGLKMKLYYNHLAQKLRMSGAVPPVPL